MDWFHSVKSTDSLYLNRAPDKIALSAPTETHGMWIQRRPRRNLFNYLGITLGLILFQLNASCMPAAEHNNVLYSPVESKRAWYLRNLQQGSLQFIYEQFTIYKMICTKDIFFIYLFILIFCILPFHIFIYVELLEMFISFCYEFLSHNEKLLNGKLTIQEDHI